MSLNSEEIWKPYNAEIIFFCDGKHSVLDIQKEIGLTYKSIFLRLKDLRKNNILQSKASEKHLKDFPVVNQEHKEEIAKEVNRIMEASRKLSVLVGVSAESKSKYFRTLLDFIDKNRYVGKQSLAKNFGYNSMAIDLLLEAGIIRNRYEITKKGKNFLEELNVKAKNSFQKLPKK